MADEKKSDFIENDNRTRRIKTTDMVVSVLATTAFAVFNVTIGALRRNVWNFGIGIYYAVLLFIRLAVVLSKIKETDDTKTQKKRSMLVCLLILVADIALVAPLAAMATDKRQVDYSVVIAIAMATYTVYKIAHASVNFKNRRKYDRVERLLLTVNFNDAVVSVLALQYVLIVTFGGFVGAMRKLAMITGFLLWAVICTLSLLELVSTIKNGKEEKQENNSEDCTDNNEK